MFHVEHVGLRCVTGYCVVTSLRFVTGLRFLAGYCVALRVGISLGPQRRSPART
ncbi:hypothetical protein [Streptomyces decoyicus]|uniref:hypothetical protein n=1 Tax=Streptomyces decoyicus TaxID=249567 RepID=UPI00386A9A5A